MDKVGCGVPDVSYQEKMPCRVQSEVSSVVSLAFIIAEQKTEERIVL